MEFPSHHRIVRLAMVLIVFVSGVAQAQHPAKNESGTSRYRLIWVADPAHEAIFGWEQPEGEPATLHYGKVDHEREIDRYGESVTARRVQRYHEMRNCYARLRGLEADTDYFFCLKDEQGISRRFVFRTAPDRPQPFTFISGGDSRNFRDVRILANQFCERLQPLFVAFTGDMINKDEPAEWHEWFDDWQETTGKDGRLIPIVAHRGNHEKRPETIERLFDTPEDAYFAFDVGGDLFRYYTLNSEIPADGAQLEWLSADLERHADRVTHLVAGYHKPMRPHVIAKSEGTNPMKWAATFYQYGMDLALESDSHVMKRTVPLKPDAEGDEGFSPAPNDPQATVFIGEGCWGAPLRAADDGKSWTIDTESFNGFDWVRVAPEEIKVKTVRVEGHANVPRVTPEKPYATPEGVALWEAKGGKILTIPADVGGR